MCANIFNLGESLAMYTIKAATIAIRGQVGLGFGDVEALNIYTAEACKERSDYFKRSGRQYLALG